MVEIALSMKGQKSIEYSVKLEQEGNIALIKLLKWITQEKREGKDAEFMELRFIFAKYRANEEEVVVCYQGRWSGTEPQLLVIPKVTTTT